MSERVSVTDFVRSFADYINRVAYSRERFVLVRGGRELAEVQPMIRGRRAGDLARVLTALPRIGDEGEFLADLERLRSDAGGAVDPWDS